MKLCLHEAIFNRLNPGVVESEFESVRMKKVELKSRQPNIIEFFRTWFAYLFLHYELITCTCMFEPWEKVFINGLVLTIFGLVTYSSWMYLPQYVMSLFDCFIQIPGILSAISFNW